MSNKDKVEVRETSEKKSKKKIIVAIVLVIIIAIALFLLWFFNRKFDVTFDYNNGTKEETVLVKYNKVVDEKDIKDKEDLGETFINWYEVVDVKAGKDVLADEPYDFNSKIKEDVKLKAVYEAKNEPVEPNVEKVTITFDSNGGSKVNSITIKKGAALTLPGNPTYNGYTFVAWTTKDGKAVANKTKFSENTTLYAKWEKVKQEEPKKEEPKVEEPKKEEPKVEVKEEKISLRINREVISVNGTNDAVATATVENKQGDVTYSINTNCATIDSKTGKITAKSCNDNTKAIVTATSKTGKKATATIRIEEDLAVTLENNNNTYKNDARITDVIGPYTIKANQVVTFSGACARTHCTYKGEYLKDMATFVGIFKVELTIGGEDDRTGVVITTKTTAGQKISLTLIPKVN